MSSMSAVVVGGGTMGAGIAQSLLGALTRGRVSLVERDASSLRAALDRVARGLERQHRHAEDPPAAVAQSLERLHGHVAITGDITPDLVIEAVPEELRMKVGVLIEAAAAWPHALLATNTSSLSVTELGQSVGAPRFIGLHFFNPVPRSKLVEIVLPDGCSEEIVGAARSWVSLLGKESIEVHDAPGFATSRLGVAIALEAIRMVQDGVASPSDIDRGMVLGYQFPVGPLELTDRIGLDVRLAIAEHLAETLGERFTPPELLRSKVAAGELGQKSGRGFYDWSDRL